MDLRTGKWKVASTPLFPPSPEFPDLLAELKGKGYRAGVLCEGRERKRKGNGREEKGTEGKRSGVVRLCPPETEVWLHHWVLQPSDLQYYNDYTAPTSPIWLAT